MYTWLAYSIKDQPLLSVVASGKSILRFKEDGKTTIYPVIQFAFCF
jgi:hypothetical protein